MQGRLLVSIALLVGLAAGAAASWWVFQGRVSQEPGVAPAARTGENAPAAPAQRKALYWYDPMVPDQHFDKPGKSPFMDMDLVPMYADEAETEGAAGTPGVSIDPRTVQNLGVRTAEAVRDRLWRRVDTVGVAEPDENRTRVVQARAEGYVERLLVRTLNAPVRQGQALAEVYSPDLLAAQEEYRVVLRDGDPALRAAARRRLELLGVGPAQIARLDAGGEAERRVVYHAPVSGVVAELGVREGASVSAGMPMFRIADFSRVWIIARVVEDQAGWIAPGNAAEVSLAALPGARFEGRVEYLYPEFDAQTRTLRARIALDNPRLKIKPGMYAQVTLFGGKSAETVVVPTEAVIQTGRRALVMVRAGAGRFTPVAVTPGIESEGRTQILAGLEGGEQVVVSGQFLIESEARLKGALDRLGGVGEVGAGTDEP
jgi:Cu(I)/Ag(I) efflux system membrane fusion protein